MAHFLGTADWKTFLLGGRQCWVLAGAGLLAIGVNASVAPPGFPFEAGQRLDGVAVSPSDQRRAESGVRLTQLGELMQTVTTERSRLDELSRLAEQVVAKMDDLAEATDQATAISHRLGQLLATEHQRNLELSGQKEEMAAELMSLRSAGALVDGQNARLRDQLASAEERLAAAAEVRTKTEAKLIALQERFARDDQQILGLQTQISTLEEQLKEKDAALEGLAFLRTEREELRYRLAAMEAELMSEKEEKDRLSSESVTLPPAVPPV